jgi:hypothetical protein
VLIRRDSWNKQKGTDKTQAKQRYVAALIKVSSHAQIPLTADLEEVRKSARRTRTHRRDRLVRSSSTTIAVFVDLLVPFIAGISTRVSARTTVQSVPSSRSQPPDTRRRTRVRSTVGFELVTSVPIKSTHHVRAVCLAPIRRPASTRTKRKRKRGTKGISQLFALYSAGREHAILVGLST